MPTTVVSVAPGLGGVAADRSRAPEPGGGPGPDRAEARRAELLGAAGWAALVAVALVWGSARVADAGVGLRAAPLYGRWSWHLDTGLVPAALVAAVVVVAGPVVARRCPTRWLPLLAGAAAVVWTAALAASDGWDRLAEPLASEHEYLAVLPAIDDLDDLGRFVDEHVERLRDRPIHVQGHPPGPVVLAWGLDRVGLGGAGWLAAVALAGWGAAVAAALVAAGVPAARRAAPALVLVPAAVWAGTSLDALFAGIAAVAVAAGVVAARRSSPAWAGVAGVAGGTALLCTYGAPLVLLVGVAGAAAARPARPLRLLVTAGAGAAVPLGLAAWAGFWWPDGLAATGEAYWDGIAAARPAAYLTLAGNPAALALATGPAVAAGLAARAAHRSRHRTPGPAAVTGTPPDPDPADPPVAIPHRRRWTADPGAVLPWAALVAVVLADLSQMSRGEVERIWLPFVPWLALAAPGPGDGARRWWLATSAAVALVLEASLVSAW